MTQDGAVYPMGYQIEIEPDLSRKDFTGTVRIHLHADQPSQTLSLNLLDIAVRSCNLIRANDSIACPFKVSPADETLHIDLPEPLHGDMSLKIEYYGEINQSMAGFYQSHYTMDDQKIPIAVTQFQESDARRAFPCMDHPVHKAWFEVALIVDASLTAISNMPIDDQAPLANGKSKITFQKTPRMSTYLLFFGMGDFEYRPGDIDPRVRIVWLPGMADVTEYGLQFGEKALQYCESYFGIPYPLPKLDLIAVPDFAFGAMENWGAITFRENLLLYDPEITSAEAEERICEVIAHEIVHQWFGNLVTPSDWQYLWLNESFATYFGFGVVAHYHPDWQIWEEFLASQTAPAMARDGLTDTSAIEISGGSHVVINSSTAPIIYSKGGSVLRQVEGYLGGEAFQSGLNHYLNQHAYDCAASQNLWMALETVSGQPISDMMRAWVSTPGHPMVIASRSNDQLRLQQKQFTYLGQASDAVWPIPLLIRVFDADGTSHVMTEMMDTRELSLEIGADAVAYKINDRQTGFYRTAYDDPHNFDSLCRLIHQKHIPEIDRWGIENDVYAMVKARHYGVDQYLAFLSEYEKEDASIVVSAALSHLYELFLILSGPTRDKAAQHARQWITDIIHRLDLSPGDKEPHGVLRLRSEAVQLGAFLDIPEVMDRGSEHFDGLVGGKKLPPDIRRAVMQAGARAAGNKAYEWFTEQIASVTSEQERINILIAMGCFKDTEQIQKALAYIMEKAPDRNKFIPVAQMARNPNAIPLMWDWYTRSCPALKNIHPLIHERIIGAVIPVCGLEQPDAVKTFFDSAFDASDPAAPVIQMAFEKLEINRRLRAAN